MQKTYQRINWENYPSESTPINETNLNAMDYAVDELDNRVITHETTKATKTEVSTVITDVSFNENTGTFTFTRKNGGTITVDTILEKMMINFRYDYENQRLVITLDDGSVQYVDMSALLTQYEFADSDTLAFSLTNGKISAIVKNGSIQEKHLRPEYLAAIKVESAKAESGAKASATSEANAKSYAEQAKASADRAEEVVGITYATEEKAGIVSPQDIYVNPQNGEMITISKSSEFTLSNSHAGGIKLNLGGVSEQNGEPTPDSPVEINSVVVSEIKSVGKNIFNINGNVYTSGHTLAQNNHANTVENGVLTSNVDTVTTVPYGQVFNGLKGKTITISADVVSLGTGIKASIYIFENNWYTSNSLKEIDKTGHISFKYTCTDNVTVVTFGSAHGTGAQFTNIQVEFDEATDYEEYKESVVTLSKPITLNGIGESMDILTPENVKRRFYTERVTTSMLALKEVNYNDTNTKGFTIIPSKKCNSVGADNIKCTIAIYGSGTEKNTCRIKDSESIAIFLDMGEFPSLSDFSNYLASNEVYITYELAEEITEVLPTADQIALRGLKSFKTVTHISTDSAVKPLIFAKYGTSEVGALALENSLLHEVKDILLGNKAEQSEVDAIVTSMEATRKLFDGNYKFITVDYKDKNFSTDHVKTALTSVTNNYGAGYRFIHIMFANYAVVDYIGSVTSTSYAVFDEIGYSVDKPRRFRLTNGTWAVSTFNLTDYMVAVEVEFDFTEVDTFQTVSKDITSLIPVGYKVIDAHGVRGGGDYVFISDISLRDNTLSLALYNPSGNIDSGYPAAKIICVRDI